MSLYYLTAQLPSLDTVGAGSPLPITEERFVELCHRFLGKKARQCLDSLTLSPPREIERSGSSLVNAWNRGERDLRLALGVMRARRMKKAFEPGDVALSDEILKTAQTVAEMTNPMEAERYLFQYRLHFLESLRPVDIFAEDYIFYYGLKLKLVLHANRFDTAAGKLAYRNIYNSILNGDRLEVLS